MKVTTDLLFDLAANDVELRGCFFLLVINSIDVKISQNWKKLLHLKESLSTPVQSVVRGIVEFMQIAESD